MERRVAGSVQAGGADGRGYRVDAEGAANGHLLPVRVFNSTGRGWWNGPDEHAATMGARDYKDTNTLVASPSAVAYQCHGTNVGPMGTLRTGNGHVTGGVPFVEAPSAYSIYPESGQGADLVAREIDGAVPALTAIGVAQATDRGTFIATPIQDTRGLDKAQNGVGIGEEGDPSYTLDTTGAQGAAYAFPLAMRGRGEDTELEMGEEGIYNALRAGDGGSSRQPLVAYRKAQKAHNSEDCERWEEADAADTLSSHSTVAGSAVAHPTEMLVRRLTPTECTRLQGFPDSWLEDTDADAEEAHPREVLRQLWLAACAETAEGRQPGVASALLTPEVLLAGVHGGWIPWPLAVRCAASAREVQGPDAWPEGFMRGLWAYGQDRPTPYRREPFEQLSQELGRSLSTLPLEETSCAQALRCSRLWAPASAQWPLRHARPADEAPRALKPLADSHRYRMLGNAVAVPVAWWVFTRIAHIENPEPTTVEVVQPPAREADEQYPRKRRLVRPAAVSGSAPAAPKRRRLIRPAGDDPVMSGGRVRSVVIGTNAELVADAARLYIRPSSRVIDLTYGRGLWWEQFTPEDFTTNDLYVPGTDHAEDYRNLPAAWANSFDVAIFDPPYTSTGNRANSTLDGARHGDERGGDFHQRYGLNHTGRGYLSVWEDFALGMREANKILRLGGLLWVKCCDFVESGERRWGYDFVTQMAPATGFKKVDTIVHVSGTGPQPLTNLDGSPRRQQHSHRAHSFLVILKKTRHQQ